METLKITRPPGQTSALEQIPVPAAIYARISRDRAGAGLGVERQEADCRALAERLGWQVVAVYVDNDISAYSGRRRPEYERMLDAVRAGEVRGVIAWHTDRLHRRATELEEFVTIAEAHYLEVQSVTAGNVDLSSASGRMVARMLGAAAQHEIDHARERVRRAKAQAAADGKYRGGMRPYGYESDGTTVREDEAQVIREASEAILAGRTLAAVERGLNERGLRTSTGNKWTYNRVRDVLIRPRNAGLLSTGRADRGEAEIVGKAQWAPILDEETWRALYKLLIDPARRKQQNTAVRWVGSGIYICGKCGEPMRCTQLGGSGTKRGGTVRRYYRCSGANHLMIRQDKTDKFVLDEVADLVRDDRVRAAMHPHDDDTVSADRQRRAVLIQRMANFEDDYAEGAITGSQLQRATASVTAEMEQIDGRMAVALRQVTASPVLGAPDPGEAFLKAPVDVQRAVLAAVLRVEVLPAASKGVAFSTSRLRLTSVGAEQ